MKKSLLVILCALASLSPAIVKAQTPSASFTMEADTVWGRVVTTGTVLDSVVNVGIDTLNWHVTTTNFPTDWLAALVLGICDGNICRQNTSNQLWNPGTSSGATYSCPYPGPGNSHIFDLSLDFTSVTSVGSYYLTAILGDHNFNSHTATFIVNNFPTAVTNVNKGIDQLHVFPNPAKDQAHITFNMGSAGNVKLMVYDAIGRLAVNVPATQMNAGEQQIDFSTTDLASGIYNVVVLTEYGKVTQHLSIVK